LLFLLKTVLENIFSRFSCPSTPSYITNYSQCCDVRKYCTCKLTIIKSFSLKLNAHYYLA